MCRGHKYGHVDITKTLNVKHSFSKVDKYTSGWSQQKSVYLSNSTYTLGPPARAHPEITRRVSKMSVSNGTSGLN